MTKVVSARAMRTIIEKHKLQPIEGEYQITPEMIAQAAAVDKANGDPGLSSEEIKNLSAAMNGEPSDWKAKTKESGHEKEHAVFQSQIESLLRQKKPAYAVAISVMCDVLMDIAVFGLDLDEAEARMLFAAMFKHGVH